MTSQRLIFFDTTLRDGEQSPGCSMNVQEKLEMAHAIESLGVDVLEAGFAMASKGDSGAIKAISREVRNPTICSMARANKDDIEADVNAPGCAHYRAVAEVVNQENDGWITAHLKVRIYFGNSGDFFDISLPT